MNTSTLQLQFVIILLTITLGLSIFILKPFLVTILLALIFAIALHPLYIRLLEYMRGNKPLASTFTIFIIITCVLVPLLILGVLVFNESVQLYSSLTNVDNKQVQVVDFLARMGDYFNTYLPGSGNFFTTISNNITLYIKVGLTWVINHLGSVLSGASIFLLHAFIFIITLYYVLIDGQNLKKRIIRLSPLDDKEDESVFARLELAVNSVIKGNVVIASIQGTLTALGFVLFGIPNSILWGLTAVISSLIPSIGTALVLVPGVLYLFVTGSTLNAVGLLLWGTIIVGAVDNVLKPKLIGTQLQVHPLFVLLSILGGISLLGPIGILLGPLVFSLLFALIDVYSHIKSKR